MTYSVRVMSSLVLVVVLAVLSYIVAGIALSGGVGLEQVSSVTQTL